MNSGAEVEPEHAQGAVENLTNSLGPRTGRDDTFPDVFVLFDEAHALTELKTHSNRTYFVELRSVLHDLPVGDFSLFAFFLSTTSKISQFAMPKDIDQSHRVGQGGLKPSLPFSDLVFDHLMHTRKIFDTFKTIGDVTSTECVVHMGRPL